MKIQIINDDSQIVAKETEGSDGYFSVSHNGIVFYHNQADNQKWFTNINIKNFRSCVDIFNWYSNTVITFEIEEEQLLIVEQLKSKLLAIESWADYSKSYWETIIFQAEAGHL